jgi:GTP-binding protein Era
MTESNITPDDDNEDNGAFRCGTVAIVGRPNVGKSTLLNHILGMKLAITSRKAQTTRHRLLGIHTTEDTQFLFVDTPGFQQKHLNALNKGLNKTVTQVLTEVDVVLFVIEPMKLGEADRKVLSLLSEKTPTLLVVNKSDLMGDKGNLLPLIQDFDLEFPFAEIVPVSAKKSLHLDELLDAIRQYLPVQPAIYPEDELTDKNERFLAAELVREKIFRLLGDEIPYSVAVEIEKFEVEGKLRRIFCAIIVDKESQKPMLIGKNGEKMKQISTEARQDMEKLFGGKVYLETWVKVKGGWADDERALKSLGY